MPLRMQSPYFSESFHFCPYCGSKLENDPNIECAYKKYFKIREHWKQTRGKKDVTEPFPERTALLKGD